MGRVTRPVAIALGSNLGDRRSHLDFAVGRLGEILEGLAVSTFIDTIPVGAPDAQGLFLNAAATGRTSLAARSLLEDLLKIEQERGRTRSLPNAARTLDLDLILCGDEVVDEPGLTVPHPRFRTRSFVLDPLVEIAPDLIDPVTGLTVMQLKERLDGQSGG